MGVFNQFDPQIPSISKTDFLVGGAAVVRGGLQYSDHFRFDGVMTWTGANVDQSSGQIDILAATANVYYDFMKPESRARPYLGVGLGVAGGWLESSAPDAIGALGQQNGVGMAYLISGGGRFALTDSLSLSLAWQFLGTAALIDSPTGSSIDPTLHDFMIGLHRSF